MRAADIVLGDVEYALKSYTGVTKVRVVDKGLRLHGYSNRRDGVQIEHLAGQPLRSNMASTRDIRPWTSQHDATLRRQAESVAREERLMRVAGRLGVSAVSSGGRWIRLFETDFYELAERLGVATD